MKNFYTIVIIYTIVISTLMNVSVAKEIKENCRLVYRPIDMDTNRNVVNVD